MSSFPKGWFFIKNLNNGYVLSTEKYTAGEPVVIATVRSRDYDTQLWQHGEDGRLHNKKTGFVLDIAKGLAKVGTEIIQANDSDSSESQTFGLSSDGHIYLTKNPNLVVGIKESFFTRREGQHVHLQALEKNVKEAKEQRWDFISPSMKRSPSIQNPINSLKRTISGASLGSFSTSSTATHSDDDGCLDDSAHNQLSSFPDSAFFIKSDATGYFIGVDAGSINSPGGRLSLEPLRKHNYDSQLWHYDVITGRLINTHSGFSLTADTISDESYIYQSSSATEKDLPLQSWVLTDAGEIKLKSDGKFVLGYKKDNWFGLNREGASVLLQKKNDNKTHSHHRFVVVMPVFKKKTTEIVTVSEQIGVFPDGYFFIKNQKHGLVVTVLETEKLAAQVVATQLDTEHYNRQLWKHNDGFLFNKASNLVLDVRGGCIVSGSELCQYKQKNEGFENQQWGLSAEGYIHAKTHKNVVLALSNSKKDTMSLRLSDKKTPDHEEQRWNFVLPVFKQTSSSVTETNVQKSVCYHHYAQYPSGWFFIRSFVGGSSVDSPLVLTADSSTHELTLTKICKDNWRRQLWMYWNGVLINFETQLAIDVDNVKAGSKICQELRKAGSVEQRWNLTIEGYFVHGSNPSLTLVPEVVSEDNYKLVLADHISVKQEHRWGLLSPEIKVEDGHQVLSRWSITLLTEWKQTTEQAVQKVVHRIANWPEETFLIGAHDGLALAPEKSEAYSFLVVKKLEIAQSEHFKWTYRNGYVVHVATGLVLHASDDLVGGSQLQIREELLSDSKTIDQRQRWIIKTDGSIVSELKGNLGFALIQQGNQYHVQLAYSSNTSEHYNWGFARCHYEKRYSDVYKKEVNVVTRTERILLTVQIQKHKSSFDTKLVSHSYGVFPENWFYIRSKADSNLVLTVPSRKEGAKLILSKIDHKIFRRQLWHVQDDGCLVNLESDFVIDVAGGAFNAGSDIIQWHEKYLRKHRKNQIWGLSVDGHLHPKARPGLVLGAKDGKAVEGAEIQLHARGSLDLSYQLWTFATPIFGRRVGAAAGVSTAAGVLERNDSDVFIDSVNETTFKTSTTERYERKNKLTVVRRWGLFPEGGFFIRSGYGDAHLALTVERKSRIGENGRTEFEVTLRPINFKEYKWHFWFYKDGHLINAQTGLALDASPAKGLLVEDGLRTPLFVRDQSMSENQFWSLTADGEIYLRSDEHLVIGVSNSRRVSVSGAQVGLRELRVRKYLNENNQQETSIKSEPWLKWVFSKPVYGSKTSTTTTTTTTTSTTTSISEGLSASAGLATESEVVEGCTDEVLSVKHKEESADDYSESDDDDDENESSLPSRPSDGGLLSNIGIATAGAGILAGTAGVISNVITSAPETISTAITGKKQKDQSKYSASQVTKKTSYKSLKYDRKDSYHADINYVPTGFEKVIRYKTHQKSNFPTSGYFMIKSYLHGFVLDVVDGETKDGAFVALSAIKSTDFASQLWSYQDGRVVNLKGHNLVLDATMTDEITSGERLVISTKTSTANSTDQHWEFGTEGGLINLKSNRSLVLGVKELKHVTDKNVSIDVFIQEEKSHLKSNFGRPEQRWEVLIPALVPIDQTTKITSESKYTIIEGGKVSAISSSVSAIIAFEWLKETFHHKITSENQWPSSQNWFFIRIGNENAFLSSGNNDTIEIKFVSLGRNEDHKKFLWAYVDGYLVNYKYMLRLSFDQQSKKLLLSNKVDTLNQHFSISGQGNLSVKIGSETTYFSVVSQSESHYELTTSSETHSSTAEHSLQVHIPVFNDVEIEKDSKVALSTVISWITTQKSSTTTIATTTTTTTTKIAQRYGVFPNATWFFIKAETNGGDSLVLAVKDSSTKSNATLVLKKLSFKDFKSQLWTFRNGVLINYGSKLAIDVFGEISGSSKLVQTAEAGISSQKWSLTEEGRVHLESYSQYTWGYHQTDKLTENIEVVLVKIKDDSNATQSITWKFSVPVFGSKSATSTNVSATTTTVSATISSIERISTCIEQGEIIESVEEADIKVEDTFVKKNTASVNSSASTAVVEKEKHHKFQDVLTGVGIAVTAGAVGAAVISGASKIAEKYSEHETKKTEEKKDSSKVSTEVIQSTASAVTDVDKKSETIIVRRSQRTSVQIIEESRVIVRAWKIVFSQKVHRCKSKTELVQTIEESREELFRRLDEHLRAHASVEQLVAGAVPEWHVSIHQVKELFRARIFEKLLDSLSKEEVNSASDISFDSTLSSAIDEIESHYKVVIENQSSTLSSSETSTVTESQTSELSIQEKVLVTVDTIKVTVRYWMIGLYEAISVARSKGSSEEDIKILIDNSRKELTANLAKIKTETCGCLEKSSSTTLNSKQTSIVKTIETAISQTETVVTTQLETIYSKKEYSVSEEHWLNVTRTAEERLSSELKVYQTSITQEISEVEKTEIKKSDQAEISIVLDEKMVAVAQQTVANKLIETQTKISSWYTEVSQQISYILEESKTSASSEESIKKDTIAIVDAAQIEIATRIEETKLVLRAYYAHLTYLSWAERRRIEYSLDNVKASLIASITQFKKTIEKSSITKEQIVQYSTYSFGASASRIVLTDIQSIVHKVTNVKETTTIVNTSEEVKAEKTKIGIIGETSTKVTEVTKTTDNVEASKSKQQDASKKTEVTKVEETKKNEVIDNKNNAKIVDTVLSEVEQTKIGKVDNGSTSASVGKQQVTSSKDDHTAQKVSAAVIGAATAAMASAAIFHHYEGKEQKEQETIESSKTTVVPSAPVAVINKPASTQTNVIVGKSSDTVIRVDDKKTSSSSTTVSKQEKSESLVVVYESVQVTVTEWLTTLKQRVFECAQKKSTNVQSEIDTIISEAQQQLFIEIEKAKRNTTTIVGTSQTSFHDTLSWVRTTAWKQAVEVKRIGFEIATSSETNTKHFEEQLETLKITTLEKINTEIEKTKTSASVIHTVGHQASAVIAAGKKFEGVDYSKTSCGKTVEKTKVSVGILVEETRVTVQEMFTKMTTAISERRKQGGENVQSDIEVIIKNSRQEIDSYVAKSKSEFEQKVKVSSTSKVETQLTNETVQKVHSTLEKVKESYLIQVTQVEKVTNSSTITSETEYVEKLAVLSHETRKKLDATLSVSETVIGHHIEVIAESSDVSHSTSVTKTEEKSSSSSNVSLGMEYGLLVVSETTKSVSSQISALVERIHHRVTVEAENADQDVICYVESSEQELDLIFDQAKEKISYELSMVASHEKVDEKHFLESIEALRVSTKKRISQIQTVATVHKEETKTVSEKLLQIAEESRHEVTSHFESVKQSVTAQAEKVSQVIHNGSHEATASTQVVVDHAEIAKKQQALLEQQQHESKVELAKKALLGAATIAAGAAIAVEVTKKLNEHNEKVQKVENKEKQTALVVEEVHSQYQKWISSLTETVISKSKQTSITKEELSITIEKSKTEFIEIIKKAKSNEVVTESHQHDILSWIEQTAIAQASRIEEIAVASSTSTAINVESRLEIIKASTSQEIEVALEKCKHTKSSTKFVGVTIDQLKQKESALLDVRSELVVVIQDVKTSLVSYFQDFTKSVVARIQKGGDNVEKDVSILVANIRKDISVYIETVKNTATKRLSALETKSSNSVISVAALSGIATAEIISVLKACEETITQKVNRVHSHVWYISKEQNTTEIIQSITKIETETTSEITTKVESSKYGFVTSVNEQHKAGHVTTIKTDATTEHKEQKHLEASLTVQEIKVTIREWLRTVAEQVSICAKKGGSQQEIDLIIEEQNKVIFEYLDVSVTKISATVKSEESIKHLHSTVQEVKSSITKTSSEIKKIGIEASKSSSGYGGFEKMTSVITEHEHRISEVLVVYEENISKEKSKTSVVDKTASTSVIKKDEKQKQSASNLYTVVTVEYILSVVHTWLEELMVDVSEVAKKEHNITVVTKEIDSVVSDAKEFISAEFELIAKKLRSSKGETAAVQELINILEWTRGMILQSSTQIRQIGINCAVSFSSTGGIEQMKPLVSATESQIIVAVGRCNKTVKIDVERNSAHSEKLKVKKECRKEERKKAECVIAEKKKAECIAAEKKKAAALACAKKNKEHVSDSETESDSGSGSSDDTESESEDDHKEKKTSKKKTDCDKKSNKSEAKKKTDSKKTHKQSDSEDSGSESDKDSDKKKEKKSSIIDKSKVAAGVVVGGAILKKYSDSKSDKKSKVDKKSEAVVEKKSETVSDKKTESVVDKKSEVVIDKKKPSTGQSTLDVTIIVRQWYEQLIIDVSERAKKGGSSASADIELIVQTAVSSITETLRTVSINAQKSITDITVVQNYRNSIEWAKNLVIQSSLQIQAIGINCAASSSSRTGGIEQMRPIAVAIQEQVNVEIRRYKLTTTTTEVEKHTEITAVEHKQNYDVVCTGHKAAVNRKEYCAKLEKHVSQVVSESKLVIIAWFDHLVREVSVCIHQGGNVEQNVAILIEKSKVELNNTIKRTQYQFTSSIDVYEGDETFALIETRVKQSLEDVQSTINSKIVEIKEISVKSHSDTEVTEKLSILLEKSKVNITEILETNCKQSIDKIQKETVQTESTVRIIDTVDSVKSVVTKWQTKLTQEIHSISIDTTIQNKEERIELLIKEANTEIERVSIEAKTKISHECKSVKKISKSKELELTSSIDYVKETFTADVKRIQQLSVEAIKKSDVNVKERITEVISTSHQKIDSHLTQATAAVVGVVTAAIAVHAIKKHEKEEKKKEEHGELSVDVHDNVKVISKWFELFTKRISESVRHSQENVIENVNTITEHAELEISEIITTARTDFIKRLSRENLDQESYNYACKHYEESLESVRVSIISQVSEAKKVAIEAHTSGNTEILETKLSKLTTTSQESIKTAMESSVVITHKTQEVGAISNKTNAGSVLQIEVKEDEEVLGEQDIEFERKEQSVTVHEEERIDKKTEKVEEKKEGLSKTEKIAAGAVIAGATIGGAALLIHKKNEKEEATKKQQTDKKQQETTVVHQNLRYDSGVSTIESVKISISEWFTSLIQKVSTASKSGASSKQITTIVETSRTQLTQIIEHAKTTGSNYCSSASDEQQFVTKLDWVASVAHNQAVQIQQIGINASVSKSDMTSQMEALSTATYHQIEVTLEQVKTSVTFHQKINKINSSKTKTDAEKTTVAVPVCGKMEATVDKTKIAYSVIQETRVTTVALFVSLSERIVTRIRQGGSHVQEDITEMIDSTEHEVTKIFQEAKQTSSKVDEKTRIEIEEALTSVHKTVKEQIIEVKTVTVEAVSTTETDSKVAINKVLEVSKNSKTKIETTFTSVSETITAGLVVVSETAQKATETVQNWFSNLTSKINKLLEASDCSAEETQVKINAVVAEAETEMNKKLNKLQETTTTTTTTTTSTTEVSTDHHLDVFFGNIKSSVQAQLDTVKATVQDTTKVDKEEIISKLQKTESKLKQETSAHYEAVEQITSVEHITGTEQKVSQEVEKNRLQNYKNTITNVALGSAAVAAAAAAAITFHKNNQQSQTTAVQVVKETSIQDIQVKIDRWLAELTEKVTSCTKKGGSNVSVEVQKIVENAQSELEVTINEAKSQHSDTVTTTITTEQKRTFVATLEWIKTTAYTQSSQITHIVNSSSSSSVDLTTQIENHVHATKQQIDSALEVHYKSEKSTVVEQSGKKNTEVVQNVVEVVTETREQTQKRFTLETTVIVQESKTRITNWLILLLENITSIIHGNSETIRKDIFARLDLAQKEVDVFITETKQKFSAVSKTTNHVEANTLTLVVNSVKQTLDCIDSIRATLVLQISVLREVITRIEVEDIDVITERLEAVITRTQKRVHHTLEVGISLAISSAFEGKVVTWTETAVIPQSFKNVRAIAFDVLGTVANYQKTLHQVWKQIVTPKNDVVLRGIDFHAFVEDWYGAYNEIKASNFSKKRPVSDDISLHEALVHILKRYYIKDLLTEAETEQLCEAWRTIGVYEDASIGIRRLKTQASAKYATVAISDTFSTKSMIELAQNNGLCWHAQFSAEMFASQSSSTTTASESVVKGTIQLLGLERAEQLAIVSSSPHFVAAAKKNGCHAILVEREEEHSEATIKYDVKVDGIDILGESVQSFLEHESMVQVWSNKEAPSAPRVWVQKLSSFVA